MPTNDALRELAERTSKDHGAGSTGKWCYLCLWGWPCPPHTTARALLAALDVVEAAGRVDNDFAGFGKDIARCSRQSAQNLRDSLARFKEQTDA
jgi:hypothetical protein